MSHIVTTYVYPPIPDRSHDWCAHSSDYDGAEDAGWQPVGWGRTKDEAVADYLELIGDEAP